MLHKVTNLRDFKRKVSPPQPTFMTDEQKSEYLASLRSDRPARPSGSRPSPFKISTYPSPAKEDVARCASPTVPPESSQSSVDNSLAIGGSGHPSGVLASPNGIKPLALSTAPARSPASVGRPLASAPVGNTTYSVHGRKVSPMAGIQGPSRDGTTPYRESGGRWMERQEAISLRDALQAMDQNEEEKRIHKAAQDEAADLVWKHQNPLAAEKERSRPFRNPDLTRNNPLRAHLKKGAHARSQSVAGAEVAWVVPNSDSFRSTSETSTCSSNGNYHGGVAAPKRFSMSAAGTASLRAEDRTTPSMPAAPVSPSTLSGMPPNRRRSSGQRYASGGSGTGIFRNPDDQIYEEPEEMLASKGTSPAEQATVDMPLKNRHRNSLPRESKPLPERPHTTPETKKLDRFEIYKNPPTQSHNAAYTANPVTPPPGIEVLAANDTLIPTDGIEFRSEEIRAATTMRLKDRSPKLPTPTAVSDVPGRPIVSFDKTWQPVGDSPRPDHMSDQKPIPPRPTVPAITVSVAAMPTIKLPDDDEAVKLVATRDAASIPSIEFPNDAPRPIISISAPAESPAFEVLGPSNEHQPRPLPRPARSSPANPSPSKQAARLPWLQPSSRAGVPTATCATCSLPISGRIVTAAGSGSDNSGHLKAMFHPECFTCHHCSTGLECVAFYPEPADKRQDRLKAEGIPAGSDVDIRFFCHLDFHEFFSPRCKSCKTPIEGEVVVAAGAEWHVGHFFCGECGDPFDSTTPFVERDGYAYCVPCHTRRTSARCRACKKQILDETTVEALGGKWHEACFVCFECAGGFGDEGRFFVRDVEVACTEKEKRRGLKARMEERAVCQSCEERRLKA